MTVHFLLLLIAGSMPRLRQNTTEGKLLSGCAFLPQKEYMAELCQELGIEGFNFKGGIFPPLVRIEKGRYGGTGFIRSWRWNSPAGCQ